MMPSSVLLMMASSDEATIAASSDCASTLLSSARLVVDSSLLPLSRTLLRHAHGFAEHDDRDARDQVDDEADELVAGQAAEVVEAAAEMNPTAIQPAMAVHRAGAHPPSTPRTRSR